MISTILSALKTCAISTYLLSETMTERTELYYVKKHLDLRRQCKTTEYYLTVYHDYTLDGVPMRGSSSMNIFQGMTEQEIVDGIRSTAFAATFVKNKFYPLPSGKKEELYTVPSVLNGHSTQELVLLASEALYNEDTLTDVFINSAEIFAEIFTVRLLSSEGVDCSYIKPKLRGEFVVQCLTPQDVETYESFSYDDVESLSLDMLREKVRATLTMTKDRANATKLPPAGEYPVILSGAEVGSLLSFYAERAASGMIYPHYSNYEIGTQVQGEEVNGDSLNITLTATTPYSDEGVPMIDRPLVENGVLRTIHGNARFAHYLGIQPTGAYRSISVPAGEAPFAQMKTGKYLHVVNFSDFSMDSFSGHFVSEIRLAYYCDGTTVIPVTGGSINGSIFDAQKNFVFSKELQLEKDFKGPLAVKLTGVKIAGE